MIPINHLKNYRETLKQKHVCIIIQIGSLKVSVNIAEIVEKDSINFSLKFMHK